MLDCSIGNVHEIDVTVYGWQLLVVIDARTKIPLAATVVPIQAHDTLFLRALVTQARTNLVSHARLHKPVGWQRWRRQLLQQARDHILVCAQDSYGIVHMAEYWVLLGVKRKDVPPGIGTRRAILAQDGLAAQR